MSSERQEHNEKTPWWGEHIHRYEMVLPYLSPSDKVLDIACGNGFGSFILSRKTNGSVIGGDISVETINYCENKYTDQLNLKFQLIDGTDIEVENNYFDIIVSFETIEHTTEYKKMVNEFYRAIKRSGIAIISTPNASVTSPNGIIQNPYHTQEFNYDELLQLLGTTFDEVKIFGQKYIRYSSEKSFRFKIGELVESIFYLKGVRKIPLSIQNKVMHFLINKDMYPVMADFELTEVKEEIVKCKTFFAICKKQ